MIWYLNSKLDLNLSCANDFRNLNSMVTWCINWRGSNNCLAQFIKIISHYKKIGYYINVLQQTACLVVNPITVGNFAFLFNCTLMGRTSIIVCNCSMFCCTLLYVHSSIAIILMGKRELTALLNLSSWCLVMVGRLFLAVPRGCLQFVIVVFPDHTHLLFQTLWRFWLKDLSIDVMVGAWCWAVCRAHQGFTCWISFAPVFSFIYSWFLIFALSPWYILIYMF